MERWTGILSASLTRNKAAPFFKVAASLLLSPSSETLAVPSVNAIFFTGDRVEDAGSPVIERLSDSRNIADLLVSKLGGAVNAWVVDAAIFSGPFAVYKELVPSVNARGEPRGYDADGFPASSSIVAIISECLEQVRSLILSSQPKQSVSDMHFPASPAASPPKTVILGFSKGGTVVNQLITEFAHMKSDSIGHAMNNVKPSPVSFSEFRGTIFPTSEDTLLLSISEFHYVDVGLNCPGAYLTDEALFNKVAQRLCRIDSSILFAFHGTPRQWCDLMRSWIYKEKDTMKKLLEGEAHRCEGRLQVTERFYFADDVFYNFSKDSLANTLAPPSSPLTFLCGIKKRGLTNDSKLFQWCVCILVMRVRSHLPSPD